MKLKNYKLVFTEGNKSLQLEVWNVLRYRSLKKKKRGAGIMAQ